jgi:diacylglycerol kinase (ATP)
MEQGNRRAGFAARRLPLYSPCLLGPNDASTMKSDPVNAESPFKGQTGLRRIWNAFNYSLSGLRAAFRHEDAFRQECWLAAVLIPIAVALPLAGVGKALMIASVLLVLLVELINSAIEAAIDRISLDRHHLSKRAKDIGSAAVLIALINVFSTWVLVLLF